MPQTGPLTEDGRTSLSGASTRTRGQRRPRSLQVCPRAEREQRVVGSNPDVLAARLGADTEMVFHIGDCYGEVRGGVAQVVDPHMHLHDGCAAASGLAWRSQTVAGPG